MVWVVQCFESWENLLWLVGLWVWMQSWLLWRAVGGWLGWSEEQGSFCEKQRAQTVHQTCLVAGLASGCNAEGWWWNSRKGCCLWKLPPERTVGLELGLLRNHCSWPGRETEDEQEKTVLKKARLEDVKNSGEKVVSDTLDQRPLTPKYA